MFSNNFNNKATEQLHNAWNELVYPRFLSIYAEHNEKALRDGIAKIEAAVSQGADVYGMVKPQSDREYNPSLGTPLHYAANLGNKILIQLFLEKSPQNINMLAYGETPLTLAIASHKFNAARQLLRAGADPNAVRIVCNDSHGQVSETPLQLAERILEESDERDPNLLALIRHLNTASNQSKSDKVQSQRPSINTNEKLLKQNKLRENRGRRIENQDNPVPSSHQPKQMELQKTREKRKKQIELQKTRERRQQELRDANSGQEPNQLGIDQQSINDLIQKIEQMRTKKNYHENNEKSRSKLNVLNKTLEYLQGTQTIDDLRMTMRANPDWDTAIFSSIFKTSKVRQVVDEAIKLKGDAPIDYSNTPNP